MNKKERRNLKRYFEKLSIWSLHYWFNKISDQTYDDYLNKELQRLESLALSRINFDEADLVHDTEMIVSPTITGLAGADFRIRRGKDRVLRFSPLRVTMLFFTEHKLVTYQCTFDLFTGNPLNVGIKKFFYQDIVAMEIQSENRSIKESDIPKRTFIELPKLKKQVTNGKLQTKESETFILTTSGGIGLKVQMPDRAILGDDVDGEIPRTRAEDAVVSVEKMLDSKKMHGYA